MTKDPSDLVRVAICDDSVGFPYLVAEWLRRDGRFDLVGAVDTGERLEALVADERPEVVLLDVLLPDVDHPKELVERLRAVHPGLRVLLASSLTEDVLAGIAGDAAVDGHISKAVTADKLCDALHRAARPA